MSKVFCLIFTFYNLVLGLALLNVVLAYCTEDLLPTQPIQSYKNVSKTLNEEDQVVTYSCNLGFAFSGDHQTGVEVGWVGKWNFHH